MAVFEYKAIDSSGKTVEGTMEGSDRRQVLQKIKSSNKRPLAVKELNSNTSTSRSEKAASKKNEPSSNSKSSIFQSNTKLGLLFFQQLLELHGSGMPMAESIRLLSQKVTHPELKALYMELWKDLNKGDSLASSMLKRPDVFGSSITKVIEAGEATGNLAPILKRIIAYLEEKAEIKKKVIASLSYPLFICCVAFTVVLFFLFYLLPQIQTMLTSLGGELTLSAKILINGANLILTAGPFVLAGLVVIGIAMMSWKNTKTGRATLDKNVLRIPFIGKIFYYNSIYQMANLISTLLSSGITMTDALRLTEKTIDNVFLRNRFIQTRVQVIEGASLANAFRANELLPSLSNDILAIGENTGNLVNGLSEIAKSFRNELTAKLQLLTTLVSTVALLTAFSLVALIALGIVSSIFQVSRSISM